MESAVADAELPENRSREVRHSGYDAALSSSNSVHALGLLLLSRQLT